MPYAYAALWFAIGLILIFSMGKENKVFYFAGDSSCCWEPGGWRTPCCRRWTCSPEAGASP